MNIKSYNSITEIDEKEWDSIVGRNRLICTHRYLEAIEKSRINDCRFFYPVIYESGKIIAHTSVYYISTELDSFAQGAVKKAINFIRRIWKGFLILRTLECGTPVALGNTISMKEEADRSVVLRLMVREIERLARNLHVNIVLFRDFYDEELNFYDELVKRGYVRIHNLPNTKIKIKWKSFDEYLNSMRSQYRWKIVGRMKRFYRDDISMRILRGFSDYADRLEQLWMNVYQNATEYKRERLTDLFFTNIDKYLKDRSAVLLAEKGDRIIGFTLLFFDDETLIPIYSGLDYNYNEIYCIYFNLLYKIVDVAITEGMKDIDLGITTLVPKKEMGAEVVRLKMYMRHFNPLLNKIVPRLFDMMTPQDNIRSRNVFKADSQKRGKDNYKSQDVKAETERIFTAARQNEQ